MGFGSFVYLMVITFRLQTRLPSIQNTASILLMSILIGLLSLIFQSERLPFALELSIHFILTLAIVALTVSYNGWSKFILRSPLFWVIFLLVYLVIWLVVYLNLFLNVQEINGQLKKKDRS